MQKYALILHINVILFIDKSDLYKISFAIFHIYGVFHIFDNLFMNLRFIFLCYKQTCRRFYTFIHHINLFDKFYILWIINLIYFV